MNKFLFLIFALTATHYCPAQNVTIQIDAAKGRKNISPYLYGKNNNISDAPGSPNSTQEWQLLRDAGLRFTRENGGNNATKYNWREKLSSHPDWYNNIYAHNWDYAAKTLGDSLPGVQGMWGFQLIGKAASNTSNNFGDWIYNASTWWSGVYQNLAGGGVPNNAGGSVAQTEGNPNLYLMNWTADSTVALLDHWFGAGGLGYNKNNIAYWSMDNEPDLWNSTHDDIMKVQPVAEDFMQLYFAVAKKARAKFPNIKLTGPIPASEWQWYAWDNTKISYKGKDYVWLEYFIKRIGEEQASSGIRLLDVLDIHSYPNETRDSDIVQLHRIYFDSVYAYPGANGVKTTAASGWDNNIKNENIFGRCSKWLNQYLGVNHGVTFGVSEYGFTNSNANVTATSYGSVIGTFADNGVEFFTPWYWYPGMWETLHLYSKYSKTIRVQSVSSNNHYVSAYTSVNTAGDSMTVTLVNRSLTANNSTTVNLSNFTVANGTYSSKQLSQLPSTETFISKSNNALKSATVNVSGNSFNLTLPALSTTAILLKGSMVTGIVKINDNEIHPVLYPNPVTNENIFIDLGNEKINGIKVELLNILGEIVYSTIYTNSESRLEIPCTAISKGIYNVCLSSATGIKWTQRILKL